VRVEINNQPNALTKGVSKGCLFGQLYLQKLILTKKFFRYKVDKIVLFGSRARGDYSSVSDYDIAIFETTCLL